MGVTGLMAKGPQGRSHRKGGELPGPQGRGHRNGGELLEFPGLPGQARELLSCEHGEVSQDKGRRVPEGRSGVTGAAPRFPKVGGHRLVSRGQTRCPSPAEPRGLVSGAAWRRPPGPHADPQGPGQQGKDPEERRRSGGTLAARERGHGSQGGAQSWKPARRGPCALFRPHRHSGDKTGMSASWSRSVRGRGHRRGPPKPRGPTGRVTL